MPSSSVLTGIDSHFWVLGRKKILKVESTSKSTRNTHMRSQNACVLGIGQHLRRRRSCARAKPREPRCKPTKSPTLRAMHAWLKPSSAGPHIGRSLLPTGAESCDMHRTISQPPHTPVRPAPSVRTGTQLGKDGLRRRATCRAVVDNAAARICREAGGRMTNEWDGPCPRCCSAAGSEMLLCCSSSGVLLLIFFLRDVVAVLLPSSGVLLLFFFLGVVAVLLLPRCCCCSSSGGMLLLFFFWRDAVAVLLLPGCCCCSYFFFFRGVVADLLPAPSQTKTRQHYRYVLAVMCLSPSFGGAGIKCSNQECHVPAFPRTLSGNSHL